MPLPSQIARNAQAGHPNNYRRRKRRRGVLPAMGPGIQLAGGIAALALVGVLAMIGVKMATGGGPRSAEASPTNDLAGGEPEPQRTVTPLIPLQSPPTTRMAQAPIPTTIPAPTPAPIQTSSPTTEPAGPLVVNQGSRPSRPAGPIPPPPGAEPISPVPGRLADAVRGAVADPIGGGTANTPAGTPAGTPGVSAGGSRPAITPVSGPVTASAPTSAADRLLSTGRGLTERGDPVAARALLSRGLLDGGLDERGRAAIRAELTALNQATIFSKQIIEGDPITERYVIQPNDSLSKITDRRGLATHWRLIQRVNGIADPSRIRVGAPLKLVRGPFHAVVSKSAYRLDLYQGDPAHESSWVYIRSFDVGLGAGNSTPTGEFVVRPLSKLENPAWVNPINPAERYTRDDPRNPIGEHWLGIDGLGEDAVHTGYGLHGTIDPGSIGRQASLGCVRLVADDIALLYELLGEGVSRVRIVE